MKKYAYLISLLMCGILLGSTNVFADVPPPGVVHSIVQSDRAAITLAVKNGSIGKLAGLKDQALVSVLLIKYNVAAQTRNSKAQFAAFESLKSFQSHLPSPTTSLE